MAAWAGGLAFTLPLAVRWKVAKRGYQLLGGGTAALLMIYPAVRSWWAVAGLALVLAGIWRSGRREFSLLMAAGAVLALVSSLASAGWMETLAGGAALGGITATMLLGHWFLVDPTLPRWALRRLDLLAGIGLVLSMVSGWLNGAVPFDGGPFGLGSGRAFPGRRSLGGRHMVRSGRDRLLGSHGRHRPVLPGDGDCRRSGFPHPPDGVRGS